MPNEPETSPSPEPKPTAPEGTSLLAAKPEETTQAKPEETKTEPAKVEVLTLEALKLPEGATLDKTLTDKFLGVMNDGAMTPAARAQALIDLQAEASVAASERASQLWEEQRQTWRDEIKADKEIGGAKLDENLGQISKLIDAYGSPELRQAFDVTGAGDNPHIVKFLAKVAALHSESTPTSGKPPVSSGNAHENLAAKLYPSMAKGS